MAESLSKLSEKCKTCPKVDECDNKRMELCALAELPNRATIDVGQKRDCDNFGVTVSVKDVKTIIKEQPTAYDIDKVVEKLYEKRTEILLSNDYECEIINYCLDNFDKAIEIVKQGSVSDDVCECRRLKGYNFIFKTSCGDVFDMKFGFKYCPYCGKKIKVVE